MFNDYLYLRVVGLGDIARRAGQIAGTYENPVDTLHLRNSVHRTNARAAVDPNHHGDMLINCGEIIGRGAVSVESGTVFFE